VELGNFFAMIPMGRKCNWILILQRNCEARMGMRGCHAGGRGFESRPLRQKINGLQQKCRNPFFFACRFVASHRRWRYSISKSFVNAKANRGQYRLTASEDYEVHG
jgi:hypothetical protein